MNIGVALPEWVFAQDRRTAPLVLLALVFAGLALPILAIALYLHRAQGKVGANQVCAVTPVYPPMYHLFFSVACTHQIIFHQILRWFLHACFDDAVLTLKWVVCLCCA
jgi:hypothetical protein